MTRLQSELDRLYFGRSPTQTADGVRAMVIALTGPPSWEALSAVWQGVQAELALPAPGIAVSGTDALQLWFSLAEPIPAAAALTFLAGLQSRFLAEIDPRRIRLLTASNRASAGNEHTAQRVPALQEATGNWSAFLAPDLAPVFADTPWLDIAPNEEGQATLLRSLRVMEPAAFDSALVVLGSQSVANAPTRPASLAAPPADDDPRRFLVTVMNDESVALALRIEAAKALLLHATGR